MRPVNWKLLLGNIGSRFLGVVLLVAAAAKAVEPGAFAQQIQLEDLDFLFAASTVVVIALALETGLGLLLLAGLRQIWVLAPASLMVAFFVFLNGRNYWLVLNGLRDENSSCGCFGSLLERTPAEAFWQDTLLLVPPLLLAVWGRTSGKRPRPVTSLLVASAAAVAVMVYAGTNSDLEFVEIADRIGNQPVTESFLRTDDYQLIIGETEAVQAEIYHSEASVTFLILCPRLPRPVLLKPRTGTVESVAATEILKRADNSISLIPDAAIQQHGEFQVTADGISFALDEEHLIFKPVG